MERLDKIHAMISAGRLKRKAAIASVAGQVIDRSEAKKHLILEFTDTGFDCRVNHESIELEKTLDGICVLRTSLPAEAMGIEECLSRYKSLHQAERALRTIRAEDIRICRIRQRLDDRIRAHLFLAMLAYYVEWHLRDVWSGLTHGDADSSTAKRNTQPAARAASSGVAGKTISSENIDAGKSARSMPYASILEELATISEVSMVFLGGGKNGKDVAFNRTGTHNKLQSKAIKLLEEIPAYP
jgi:hypothetical protein